jgi:hypothetical protein
MLSVKPQPTQKQFVKNCFPAAFVSLDRKLVFVDELPILEGLSEGQWEREPGSPNE